MAKVHKGKAAKQASSAKLKTIAKSHQKTVAKNVKSLMSIKNVVGIKQSLKDGTKKDVQSKKKKLSGKDKVVNGEAVGKASAKQEKSHGKSPEKTRDKASSSNSKSTKISIRSKKEVRVRLEKKEVEQEKEPGPSKVVTRRDSREKEFNEIVKAVEKNSKEESESNEIKKKIKLKAVKRVTFNVQASSPKKVSLSKEPKKKPVVNRQRVAGLNASCKVKMMYGSSEEKEQSKKEFGKKELGKKVKREEGDKSVKTKPVKKGEKKSKKKIILKSGLKRKNQDDVDTSLILDSRSSKRVASLNASAILAATLLPEPPLPKPAPKPKVVKVDEKAEKNVLNGFLETDVDCQPSPAKKKKKSEQQRNPAGKTVSKAISPKSQVSRKKSDQLQSALQLMESIQPSTTLATINSSSSPKVTGVTTTKLEVTKVQINSSGARKEKTDHQVKTILGKDFVSKYQIETNSSQSYCVQVHNSSVETHHQPMHDQNHGHGGLRNSQAILSVPPPAHMDTSLMSTSQSLSSSFSPFSPHLHQQQAHSRPMMQIGAVHGFPSFTPLSILNIPQFSFPGSSSRSSSNLRPNSFGLPPPLDLSHGNYSPAAASSGFTLLGHSPMYQPAGPMIQSNESSCLVHKPIPFHPPVPFQPQITQSLSSVSGSIFTPPIPSGLFHQQRQLQQSHLQPCAPIFVSNVAQPNLTGFFNHSSIRPSLPLVQGSGDTFAPRSVPWFPDSSPRAASVPTYPKGSSTKSTYQPPHFPRSPHVATVRPQVSKKSQKELVRSKKNASTATTKEVVHHQPPNPSLPPPPPLPAREITSLPQLVPQPIIQSTPLPKTKKKFAHGWSWFGKRFVRRVFVHGEGSSVKDKPCYPAIKHVEGEVIRVGDSVLLRSGPKKTDLPFVARITALWESSDGEMMMSLLWYYRPEHTEMGRTSRQMAEELFASKHRDVNSVACVDDKCYVLTLNGYNRFKRFQKMLKSSVSKSLSDGIVPHRPDQAIRKSRMPPLRTSSEMVFCCRKVYEFRLKRTLKNPA